MIIELNSKALLKDIDPKLYRAIERYLTMPNPKYVEAEKRGRFTGKAPKFLEYFKRTANGIECPRGALADYLRMGERYGESLEEFIDHCRIMPPVDFVFGGKLRGLQQQAVDAVLLYESGVLVAGTGAGKTVMALYIIAERKQPTLIVVHTKELINQWVDRIGTFLGIPSDEIGIIGGGKFSIGKRITVATVQTLKKRIEEVEKKIGFIICDECHRVPSTTFTVVVNAFSAKYRLGLTATPYRRDGLSRVIRWVIGDITGRIEKQDLVKIGDLCRAGVIWVPTDFCPLVDAGEQYSKALSELTEDVVRNREICNTIAKHKGQGVRLILSDRKAHCDTLQNILSDIYRIYSEVLTGSTSAKDRERIIKALKAGKCQYLIATGQLIGEGFDLPEIESVFLVTPIKFSGRLIQYIGRALRPALGKDMAVIYDFVDNHGVFEASANAREATYAAQGISEIVPRYHEYDPYDF